MSLSLLAMIAAPATALTIGPKFHGGISYWIHPEAQGCSSYHFGHKWNFNFTTGKTTVAATSHAHNCANAVPGVNDQSFGCACAQNTLAIKLKIPTGGASAVGVAWTEKYTVSGSYATAGACPTTFHQYIDPSNGSYDYNYTYGDCYAASSVFFGSEGTVADITNGTFVTGSNVWAPSHDFVGNETFIFWGCEGPGYTGTPTCFSSNSSTATGNSSYSITYTLTGTTWFNSTYVAAHHYYFELFFYGNPISQAGGYPTAKASTAFNAYSGSNGLDIKYIRVL